METNIKNQWKLIGLAIFYILLASLGIYSITHLFFFPILAVPWTLYSMKEQANIKQIAVTHLISMIVMLLVGKSFLESILYAMSVVVPSIVFTYCYNKKITLPHSIIYNSLAVTIAYFLYFMMMKQIGFDYIVYYFAILDEYKEIYFSMINQIAQDATMSLDEGQVNSMKSFIMTQIDLLKVVYPSLFLLLNMALSTLYTFVLIVVGAVLKRNMPSLNTLGQFTFSKILTVLLIISMIGMPTSLNTDSIGLLMTNIFFLAGSLMQLLGTILTIMFIWRCKWGKVIKMIVTLLFVMIAPGLSTILMSLAVLDTLFNFRKVDIII